MRWRQGRRSTNIEDRRGSRNSRGRVSGGLKLGGGATIIIVLIALFLGQDPVQLLQLLNNSGSSVSQTQPIPRANSTSNEHADFVSVILADTEDTWGTLFKNAGSRYQPPILVLYTDVTQSACGLGSAASGPFYCPGDNKVYLDTSFFQELKRLGAPGDFAIAYVIAHEVGHHLQNLLGTEKKVRQLQRQVNRTQRNALSVLMELQADCYAGVWAYHAHKQRQLLEQGDIEEGLQAASSIGDDRLQRMAGKRVHPESFTHGSSKQRVEWFRRGLQTGNVQKCDTFAQVNRI